MHRSLFIHIIVVNLVNINMNISLRKPNYKWSNKYNENDLIQSSTYKYICMHIEWTICHDTQGLNDYFRYVSTQRKKKDVWIFIMINLRKMNRKNIFVEWNMSDHDHLYLSFALFHLRNLTILWRCLFLCIWHWRGGVIVWIWIITTFNLPSMRWWWRTMNINYWCPWRSHNLKSNEKNMRKKTNQINIIFLFFSLRSSFFSPMILSILFFLYRSFSYIHCVCASSVIKKRQMNINIFTSWLSSRNAMN